VNNKNYITFGADIGGMQAVNIVQPHLIELRKLFKKYCNEPYSDVIDELAPIARVDGNIACWSFEGCQKLRLSKKERYITIDIGVPQNRWDGVDPFELRHYLINNVKQAIKLMVEKLEKEKIQVNSKRLFCDIKKVEEEFLNS
jgi:hypothetical protein